MKFLRICMVLSLVLAAGCAVGPDYKPVKPALAPAWTEKPASAPLSAARTEIDRKWWTNFDDPTLNDLVDKALVDNLDVKIALARLKEARAERLGIIAGELPDVTANGSAERTKNSSNTFSPNGAKPFNAFNAGFDASWEADIFGGRRAIEAANATLQATEESAHDVTVSLLGDVASNYIAVRNYQNQIAVAEQNLAAQRDTFELTKSRRQAGLVSSIDVAQAAALVHSTESDIPTLRTSMRQSLHSLEILLNKQPGALEALITQVQPVPVSAKEIIAGAPADLLRNRPDIREAERTLAAATATQGVAIAEMYPKISLASMFGLGSSMTSNLLTAGSKTWSLGAGVILPIFDFGRIRADINVADARQEQAFLNYQKTVLNALKEVENALVGYYQEKDRMDSVDKTVRSQTIATRLITERYSKGLISFLDVLVAERSLYTAQIAQAQSRASLSTDLIILYKALGGGWQNMPLPETKGVH